jgi:thiamine biosynthesis lipoprotein
MTITRRGFLAGTGALFSTKALGASQRDIVQINIPAFGADCKVTIANEIDFDAVTIAIKAVISTVNATMSPFIPTSEICRINKTDTTEWLALSPATLMTLIEAKRIAALTGGAFDPTLGGLVGRYGFGPIRQKPFGSFDDLQIENGLVRKGHPLQSLDLCGIAKGYALDEMVAALNRLGHDSFFVELGGEVFGAGLHPEHRQWRAGVELSMPGDRTLKRIVRISEEALATSGDRINSYRYGHNRYSHIINPKNRLPADTSLTSVSVFSSSAMTADALATALFAMGPVSGIAFAEQNSIAALFQLRNEDEIDEILTGTFSSRLLR